MSRLSKPEAPDRPCVDGIMMPVMDGSQHTRHIRKNPSWKEAAVIRADGPKAMPDDQPALPRSGRQWTTWQAAGMWRSCCRCVSVDAAMTKPFEKVRRHKDPLAAPALPRWKRSTTATTMTFATYAIVIDPAAPASAKENLGFCDHFRDAGRRCSAMNSGHAAEMLRYLTVQGQRRCSRPELFSAPSAKT